MLLFQSKRLKCDAWLLWYPSGSSIPEHTDAVEGYRHYRINIVLKAPKEGGVFTASHSLFKSKYINLFRSDKPHAVTEVKGERLVLSIGFLRSEGE